MEGSVGSGSRLVRELTRETMNRTFTESEQPHGLVAWARRLAAAIQVVSVAAIALSLFLIARQLPIGEMIEGLSSWVQGLGVWGPVVYGLVYVVAVVVLIPGAAMTVAAGAVF